MADGSWSAMLGDRAVVAFTRGTGRKPGQAWGSGHATMGRPLLHSAVAFALLAAVTADAATGRLWRFDQTAIRALETRRRHPAAVSAARAVSTLAEPAFVSALLAAFAAMAARQAGWRAACLPYLVVAGGTVARRRLSQVIARARPPTAIWLTEPEGFSLPSKHTTLAALAAGACACSVGVRGAPRLLIPLLAAAGVGTSRVLLGVHWPSDVLAGWLFAEGWLGLAESVIPAPAGPKGRRQPCSRA
jgi:membrane-associated phospholipid phosphatase